MVCGGVLAAAVVSGGLRYGEITGLTTVEKMPPGREPEVAFAGVWAQACWRYGRRPSQREMYGCAPLAAARLRASASCRCWNGAGPPSARWPGRAAPGSFRVTKALSA